jgi:Tol biopolymer transport system component
MRWIVASLAVAAVVAALLMFTPEVALDNPLANAKFTKLTDFPGDEVSPALSPDGKFAVFLSDRGGTQEVWLTQVGTGRFQKVAGSNLATTNAGNRQLGFTGDGSEIWIHGANRGPFRLVQFIGGVERPFLTKETGNLDWSPDGKHLVYGRTDPGDPMFVADHDGSNSRQLFVDREGMHNHFPTWSPDGRWIYFVKGLFPFSNMDMWRIPSTGGQQERLTEFDRFIGHPTPIDSRTVLYTGVDRDGSGPWLWAFDVERKAVRRVTVGLERYTSISAASEGRRLIASVANPVATLWSVPILDRLAEEGDVKPYPVPATRALMPRFGGKSLFYLSSLGGNDGLWRLDGEQPTEIWRGSEAALLDPPAVSRDGRHAAVVIRRNGKQNLLVITADGSQVRPLAEALEVRGAAAWSPDGKWIVTGGNDGTGDGLFKIPVDGGDPQRLTTGAATNPVWSPDGMVIAYVGMDVGSRQPLLAVRPDGDAIPLPSIGLPAGGERMQFSPDGKLIYMTRLDGLVGSLQDFWMLDLTTLKTHQLTRLILTQNAMMRTFDISPDGKRIVFDRLHNNSDIVLIDLQK